MKTYEIMFEELIKTTDFVRGQDLANRLGLSRTAIWKAIQALEHQGIIIESVKNKGYRWLAGDLLLPSRIAKDSGLAVNYQPVSQSTQLDARIGISQGLTAPRLYLASHQTAAVGRFGRSFFTSPQGGIYMSLHLKPNLRHAQLPPYTMMVAASIVKAVDKLCGRFCGIKWVNDIYVGQKKIAGVLTEAITSVETGLVTDVIIGVGLNFHITDFPNELRDRAGTLFTEQPPIFRYQLITEIWNIFLNTDDQELVAYYKEKSLVLGREIAFFEQGQAVTATAIDLTDKGELVVQLASGETAVLHGGEISLTSWEAKASD